MSALDERDEAVCRWLNASDKAERAEIAWLDKGKEVMILANLLERAEREESELKDQACELKQQADFLFDALPPKEKEERS